MPQLRLTFHSLSSLFRAAAPARRTMTTWPDFKKNWLSDPGSYPVIAVMCIALVGCTAKGTHYLATHPDARIAPSVRAAPLRTWGGN